MANTPQAGQALTTHKALPETQRHEFFKNKNTHHPDQRRQKHITHAI